ncbi:hypothetical protein [Sphingobium sp. DC-2]|uniref:hypothetical protein n=1 Tax=Sphingobium sp. DC-2 TaxID=1303256 RepID=UPI0004C45DC4|nr:hypothetical protein [Sphingobium sp. DC-2]
MDPRDAIACESGASGARLVWANFGKKSGALATDIDEKQDTPCAGEGACIDAVGSAFIHSSADDQLGPASITNQA